MQKIGFIGIGNMGGALAQAVSRTVPGKYILVCSRNMAHAEAFAEENYFTLSGKTQIAKEADVIFLGVKPHQVAGVLEELSPILAERETPYLLVSMAAGVQCEQMEALLEGTPHLIRIMPNTPVLVGAGAIPYCLGTHATGADVEILLSLLEEGGKLSELPEALMDGASSVSGCGPAFVYLFIEAMSDAAVACGLPRALATELAAQTVIGAGEMVLQTAQHPGALKDAVCSPGGSTIAGVCALEEHGLRKAVQKTVLAAFEKNQKLGKN